MNCLVVVNKNSGKGRIIKKLDLLKNRLSEKFDDVSMVFSEYRGHIQEIVKANCNLYHTIVVCGGDGSFHEAINGACGCDSCNIGYIPTGTVNDFANTLKIPKNVDRALDIILAGNIKSYDLMENIGELGAYVCGFGLFTSASYNAKQKNKKRFGKVAYFTYSFKELFTSHNIPAVIEMNGESFEKNIALALVVNSQSVAGMKFNRRADIEDGKVDVILICDKQNRKKTSLRALFRIFRLFVFGINSLSKNKYVVLAKAQKLKIEPKTKIEINMDGEKAKSNIINIEVKQKRLKIYVKEK